MSRSQLTLAHKNQTAHQTQTAIFIYLCVSSTRNPDRQRHAHHSICH